MSLAANHDGHARTAGVPMRLAAIDPDFLEAVPDGQRAAADRLAVATGYRLPPGAWPPGEAETAFERAGGAIVVRGLLVHDLVLGGRRTSRLLGPGSVFAHSADEVSSLPNRSHWTPGAEGAVIAVLDEHFTRACEVWPRLASALHQRLQQQLHSCALHTAIVALPRAEHRILALLWQLADRWGVVEPDGVAVHLDLTHALIGRLVGAQRPTVSLAIQALTEEGALLRRPSGWLLSHDSLQLIDRPPSPAAVAPVTP